MTGNKIRADIKRKIPDVKIPKGVKVTLFLGFILTLEHQETKSYFSTRSFTPEKGIDPYLGEIRDLFSRVKRRMARKPLLQDNQYPAWTYYVHPFSLWAALLENPDRSDWVTRDIVIDTEVDTPVLDAIRINDTLTLISKPGSVIINMKGNFPEVHKIKYARRPISELLEMPSCGRTWVDEIARQCIIDRIEFGPEFLTPAEEMGQATSFNPTTRENVTLIHLRKTKALPCDVIPEDAPAHWIATGRPVL